MLNFQRTVLIAASICLLTLCVLAQRGRDKIEIVKSKTYATPTMVASPKLQTILDKAVGDVMTAGNFKPGEMTASVIDIRNPDRWQTAAFEGERQLYTASVVKMFYMAALHRQLEDGKITMTKELERGLKDMIVDSSNDATGYMLDVLTDTSSGGELPQKQFELWQYKRNRVNRFFASMGYTNININQKTFCEDAYGIEQQSRNYKGQNRNMLTTNATARLLAEIATRRFVNEARSNAMLGILARDWEATKDPNSQAVDFIGKALRDNKMAGAKLWSKAGWTSRSRHDAAYIETPDGQKLVIVVFTENHANDREAVPAIASKVLNALKESR